MYANLESDSFSSILNKPLVIIIIKMASSSSQKSSSSSQKDDNFGFTGYIGYSRKLFYIKLTQFVNNKPSRVQVFNAFKKMPNLSTLIVSYGDCREYPNEEVEIYFEFDQLTHPHELITIINSLNFSCNREFIKCDNSRCKMIHISRQDTELVYQNVDYDSFSEQYHRLKCLRDCFTSESGELDCSHKYFGLNKPNFNVTTRAYKQYVEKHTIKIEHYLIKNKYHGWQHKVVEWYNNFIVNAGSNEQVRQLYLHGKSGMGKSSFIYHIFGRRFGRQIFRPLTSDDSKKYQWESFSSKLYNFVIVDEFDFRAITLSLWKQACEGREFKTLVRYQPEGNFISVEVPFVMISNFAPLENVSLELEHDPILKRLVVIECDTRDENGKEPVEFLANIDSTEGLTLEQVSRLPDSEKTTLRLARKRNREQASFQLNTTTIQVPTTSATANAHQIEQQEVNVNLTEVNVEIHNSSQDEALDTTSTRSELADSAVSVSESRLESASVNDHSLDESINIAFNLPYEVLKELLKRKQDSSALDIADVKKACIENKSSEVSADPSSKQSSTSDISSDETGSKSDDEQPDNQVANTITSPSETIKQKPKFNCQSCEKVFASKKALECHLRFDSKCNDKDE